ncbi:hypothetical protein HG535_0H00260 [Zygotorulaspora mrakii]|uniref:protein-tyrosine-phosphatase n=1 Tax=Zygotorulaspora mrakii TaxID=42260 RepID=A0A7H9B7K4_ZYGMR|nr:uncharacterized protein HG535_0H00260 [Zygotorulaspora mrakii]QLG74701.1 hypothetical protein HG535_0H00260 [Zygotorulaspora mrakii]
MTVADAEADIIRIIGGIYIGGIQPIAEHVPLNAIYKITHVLSVIKFQVIPEYLVRKGYIMKNIAINDDDTTDILQYINETNMFLDLCLFPDETEYDPKKVDFKRKPQKNGVYIHCQAGCSRSVAFTVAYLMYRYGFNLKTSLHAVKRKRASAQPNENFMNQLKIFEEMGGDYVIDSHPTYTQWKLTNSAKYDPSGADILSRDDTFAKDEVKDLHKMTPQELAKVTVLRCKKCRQRLAFSTSFINHEPPSRESSEGHFIRRAAGSHRIIDIKESQDQCSHFFVEPLNWMKEELQGKQELEGKFFCPGCSCKVGGYNWKGSRCSCGKWVIPAIHLMRNKVDQVPLKERTLPNMIEFKAEKVNV